MKFGLINIGTRQDFNIFTKALNEKGYHLCLAYDYQDNNELQDIMPALCACDVIFAAGDKNEFIKLFGINGADQESRYYQIDTLLYIFLDNLNTLPFVEGIIRECYSRFNVNLNIYRIFLEQNKIPDFNDVIDIQNISIADKFLLHHQKSGAFLDIFVRYRSDSRITKLNELILNNYFNYIYAANFSSINELIAVLAIKNNVKIRIAESFTGGRLAASLAAVPGASNFLIESLVTYSDESKKDRLKVNPGIIADCGAVSRETAYEMAKSLVKSGCDIVIATTGNAGPTAQKGGKIGKCFIAVSALGKIEVNEYEFSGNREEITENGVSHALFLLYRKLMMAYNKT